YCYRFHPDLHSFPTRRSSDLVGNNSNLVINASSSNLHQLMLLASSLQAPRNQSPTDNSANPPNIQGSATLNAVVQGTLQNPKIRSEEHTSELQSRSDLVCRLL